MFFRADALQFTDDWAETNYRLPTLKSRTVGFFQGTTGYKILNFMLQALYFLLKLDNQFSAQSFSNCLQSSQCRTAGTILNPADIGLSEAAALCQIFLSQAGIQSGC